MAQVPPSRVDQPRTRPTVPPPAVSLPKGGGAIRGIDEKLLVNPATGTASLNVPIATSPGRGAISPSLALSYDSGEGNGPFGLGWSLSIPSIRRKTAKGVPKYQDSHDTFLLSGAEDLVPALVEMSGVPGGWTEDEGPAADGYVVRRYRPRVEAAFARIERWQRKDNADVHWRITTRDNVSRVFGRSLDARIADPDDPSHIFEWLLEETFDDRGNIVRYEYKGEDAANISSMLPYERNRLAATSFANRYLKRIRYGNRLPFQATEWLFEVVFDYGEHDQVAPAVDETQIWGVREDPFSTYRSGFEIRTYRLCRRVLMFHRFAELGASPCLVRSNDFTYDEGPVATYLTAVQQAGYVRADNGSYTRKVLPRVEFTYVKPSVDETVNEIEPASLQQLPYGLGDERYQWVDLDGEGLAGVLSDEGEAWRYKRNRGDGGLTPAALVAPAPSVADLHDAGQQVMDLGGDGATDLVLLGETVAGYFEHAGEARWTPFVAFQNLPTVSWTDPNLRLIDLTGDGHADILISEDDGFRWYPSRAREGFGAAERVPKPRDEERGPALVFADGTETVFLADMSGDGLADIVRIRAGDVCYWPNLGHGRFGAKVTMAGAPQFDTPDHFDPRRIRLADIDGSGTTDIFYANRDAVRFWFNQSGNSFGPEHRLSSLPSPNGSSSLAVLDLLGTGTACLVWSSALPEDARRPMCYINLMSAGKPHLLESVKNNLGAETRTSYVPSTKFYLADRAAGRPWITRLPFPVHVVDRVEVRDHVTGMKLVTEYQYHHGYFDGHEREFRGFGMVEQRDTESFEDFHASGSFTLPPTNVDGALHLPPVHTRSWFHTGAWLEGQLISSRYKNEYYQGDPGAHLLPDTPTLPGSDAAGLREAARSLKGRLLRQEIYANDGTPKATHPYSVVEHSYHVRRLQPRRNGQQGVFYAHEREVLTYHYERDPEDPRIGHALTLDVDEFGNLTKSAVLGYARRPSQAGGVHPVEQRATRLTVTEYRVTNHPKGPWYRLGVPVETRTYEMTGGLLQTDQPLAFEAVMGAIAVATEIPYEAYPGSTQMQKRLIEQLRTLYSNKELSGPMPLGHVSSRALPWESYRLAFTPGLLEQAYGNRVNDDVLRLEGGYVKGKDLKTLGLFESGDPDDRWWAPSGRQVFDPQKFYQPVQTIDPFGKVYQGAYDAYALLIQATEDPLHNHVSVQNNYRTLQPAHLTDPNGNRAAVAFDELGLVVATAVMGKDDGSQDGDTLEDPTSRIEYQLFNWISHHQPNYIHSSVREQHGASNPRWQESYAYSGGLAQIVMTKVQAEAGLAPQRDANGALVRDELGKLISVHTEDRWVGTGRTVFDNKGNPVKQYEPFFDSTYGYETANELVELGVTPILRYDPLSRLVRSDRPDGAFSKVLFGPWQQVTWDENDTVLQSQWYAQRGSPDPNGPPPVEAVIRAAYLAAQHAGTPTLAYLDTLGRTFSCIADNGQQGKYQTRNVLDIEGNIRQVVDAKGRVMMRYDYDVLGNIVHSSSMDAGERWRLANVAGSTIRAWDSRDQAFRTTYDALQRVTHLFVRAGSGSERLIERTVHGETYVPASESIARNLRGKIYRVYDGAGVASNERFDFKGNLRESSRRLTKSTERADWSALAGLSTVAGLESAAQPYLETESFHNRTEYDALNRPTRLVTPDNSAVLPRYNAGSLLERIDVDPQGAAAAAPFVLDVAYNAKGQRERIVFANATAGPNPVVSATTEYAYDARTFRLERLTTTRAAGAEKLQDLRYTYDPVGNITTIRDDAQQGTFFNNAFVDAHATYAYDAIYRLTGATGREHIGQLSAPQTTWNDEARTALAHPQDGQAMRGYVEHYIYDEVGNVLQVSHQVNGGSWTRTYAYDSPSLIESGKKNNRLTSTAVGSLVETYAHDVHGIMTSMPHTPDLRWDVEDQLEHVNLAGGGVMFYVYDAAGNRVRQVHQHNGSEIEERIYLGGFEIYRKSLGAAITLERHTLHVMDGTRRIALVETRTAGDDGSPKELVRYQHDNHLGSAALELDQEAQVISYEEYYPYGSTSYQAVRKSLNAGAKRYRYTGKERDEGTGFYYHGARYYAPWLARWTSADPAGTVDGLNLFAYSHDDPVRLHDPTGTQTKAATSIDRQIMQMTDPQLHRYVKNLSPVERAEFARSATGAFARRASAMMNKYHMQRVSRVEEVTVEGTVPENVITLEKMTIGTPELEEAAEEHGLSIEGELYYRHTPGVIQAQDLRGFARGLVNSPAATIEGVSTVVGQPVDLSTFKLAIPQGEESGAFLGESLGPGPGAVAGAAGRGVGIIGKGLQLELRGAKLTSAAGQLARESRGSIDLSEVAKKLQPVTDPAEVAAAQDAATVVRHGGSTSEAGTTYHAAVGAAGAGEGVDFAKYGDPTKGSRFQPFLQEVATHYGPVEAVQFTRKTGQSIKYSLKHQEETQGLVPIRDVVHVYIDPNTGRAVKVRRP